MTIEAEFWNLCDEAQRFHDVAYRKACEEDVDAAWHADRASEQAMVKIIDLVVSHPQHRPTFVRCFSDLVLWKRQAPYLLVPFCMRRLRFPEIPELIDRDADAQKGTAYYANHMNHWSAINHAYVDEMWEYARCFDFYKHEVSEGRS